MRRARDNFNFEIFHLDATTPSVVVTTVLILVSGGVEGRMAALVLEWWWSLTCQRVGAGAGVLSLDVERK